MNRRDFLKYSPLLFPLLNLKGQDAEEILAWQKVHTAAGGGGSTVAFDARTTQLQQTVASTVTYSHTCTGSNLALVVFVVLTANTQTVSTITYNGVSMTQIGATDFSNILRLEAWGLAAPASGAHNVVVTLSAANAAWDTIAISFTGANQSGGASTFSGYAGQAGGAATTTSVNVTSAANNMVVDCTGSVSNDGSTSNGTQRWQDNSGATNTQGSTFAGSATVTCTETWTGTSVDNNQDVVGLSVNHA